MASRGAGCAGSPRHMRLFSNYFHFLFSFHPGNCGGRGAGAGCPTPPPQSRDAHRPGLREGRQHEKSRYILQEAEPGRGGGRLAVPPLPPTFTRLLLSLLIGLLLSQISSLVYLITHESSARVSLTSIPARPRTHPRKRNIIPNQNRLQAENRRGK